MKNSINFYDQKKVRGLLPAKKTNYINSIIYKEISGHSKEAAGKIRHNRDSKDTIAKDRKMKEDEKSTIPSKKSSLNQLQKKPSKNDLSSLEFYNIYHKLTDNFLVDTQEDTRFDMEDTKHLVHQKRKEPREDNRKIGKYIKS